MGESAFDFDDGGDPEPDSDSADDTSGGGPDSADTTPAQNPPRRSTRNTRIAQQRQVQVAQQRNESEAPAPVEGVRRSARNAKPPAELGYTPEGIEYNERGEQVAYDRNNYIGPKFNPARFKAGDFAEGNLKARSIQDNTSRNYANHLFQTEHEGPVSIDKEDSNPHKDTFTNHLMRVYKKYGINQSIMKRKSGSRSDWKVDKTQMASAGIKRLPLWFDIDVVRTSTGLPQSQTQRQKEALGFNAACHHCGWVLGTTRGAKRLTVSDLEFDGMTQDHVDIKYNRKQAPDGQMRAMGEVAKGDSVMSCGHCHRARGNDFTAWQNRDHSGD